MPNWCSNATDIYHNDPEKLREVAEAYNAGTLFQYLKPSPSGEWDYDWSVANWGTKWEPSPSESLDVEQFVADGGGTLWYDTAWAPGNEALASGVEQGFRITNMYYEPGVGFAGIWKNGEDDQYDLNEMTADEAESELPEDLNETFMIAENMRNFEDDEDEDPGEEE